MKLQLRSMAKHLWPVLFLLGSLGFIYRHFSGQLGQVALPAQLRLPIVAAALGLQLLYWLINSWCWRSAVAWYTGVRLSLLQGFSQLAMSTLGKYFPGKIWGMVARASLLVQLGAGRPQSVYATLNEQFLILHSACLSSAVLWYSVAPSSWSLALAIAMLASVPALAPLQRLAFRIGAHLLPKLVPKQEELTLKPGKMLLLLGAYCIIWVLVGAIFCCVYWLLFPVPPEPTLAARLIVANTIGIGIGFFAVFSPGGLGVREAITSGLLASQLGLEQAVLLCLMFRIWIVIFELLSGLTLLLPQATRALPRNEAP